jgi:hypothetical protein
MAKRKLDGPTGAIAVSRQINGLSQRTDFELLGIWNNLNRLVGGRTDAETPRSYLEMRAALEAEWGARAGRLDVAGWFRWPTANVILGDGTLQKTAWPTEGILSAIGYHVGTTHGRSEPERRWLLDYVFSHTLPPIESPSYMRQWGDPSTARRLHKMADVIASSARNAKHRQSVALSLACEQWEADLSFLRSKYYVGHFGFGWPTID